MNVVGSGCYIPFIGAASIDVSFSQIHNLVFLDSGAPALGGVPDRPSSPHGLTALPACLLHVGPCLDRVVAQHPVDDRLPTAPHESGFQLDPLGAS